MKTLMLALTLSLTFASGLAQAETVLNAKESEATFESIKDSAKVIDSSLNGYLKIQQGSTVCYRIPNRDGALTPWTVTCVKN